MSNDCVIIVTVESEPTIEITTEEPISITVSEVGVKGDRGEAGTSEMIWTSTNW